MKHENAGNAMLLGKWKFSLLMGLTNFCKMEIEIQFVDHLLCRDKKLRIQSSEGRLTPLKVESASGDEMCHFSYYEMKSRNGIC